MDGIIAEMLKGMGEVDAGDLQFSLGARQGARAIETIIVPLYKGIGIQSYCNYHRGIILNSVPGKVYGRVLSERMMKITEESIGT